MSINIRYPNITGTSEREQLSQIRSYMHQLVDTLNYAFSTIGYGVNSTGAVGGQGSDQEYTELKNLVMQEIQRINSRIDQVEFTEERKTEIVNAVLEALKEE